MLVTLDPIMGYNTKPILVLDIPMLVHYANIGTRYTNVGNTVVHYANVGNTGSNNGSLLN